MRNRVWSILLAATVALVPAQAQAQDIYRRLEQVADTLARLERECPAQRASAMAGAVARINALPHRAGLPRVSISSDTTPYAFLEMVADVAASDEEHISELSYAVMDGMMRGVHPRSYFAGVAPGHGGSVSAMLRVDGDVTVIESVLADGPAAQAGLAPGDIVHSIDTRATEGLSRNDVMSLLNGVAGSEVAITFSRDGAEPRTVVVERRPLPATTEQVLEWRREQGVGILTLRHFTDGVSGRVRRAMRELERGGSLEGLVIDLRGNSGGLLVELVEVADLFLDGGVVGNITGVRECSFESQTYNARRGGLETRLPVVLLVDGRTASGAEWFVAALMERGRAHAVGQRTYGRGDMQVMIPLENRRAWIALTVGELITSAGARIDGLGVAPTEIAPESDNEHDYALERALQLFRAPAAHP